MPTTTSPTTQLETSPIPPSPINIPSKSHKELLQSTLESNLASMSNSTEVPELVPQKMNTIAQFQPAVLMTTTTPTTTATSQKPVPSTWKSAHTTPQKKDFTTTLSLLPFKLVLLDLLDTTARSTLLQSRCTSTKLIQLPLFPTVDTCHTPGLIITSISQ